MPIELKLSTNPKDLVGIKKVNTFLFPAIAVMHGSHAMMDGERKYGPYNWRDKKVKASIYIAAADRHLKAWTEKQELAPDSGVHHLGHALACLAILLDAQATGNLIDDRPSHGSIEAMEEMNDRIKKNVESGN